MTMSLTPQDLDALTALRRDLHRTPDLSGDEATTAATVAEALAETGPDSLITGLGGSGVAAIYAGARPGPSIMIRCELDGLPIFETGTVPYRSTTPGKAHLCGHDGHMAIVLGLAKHLGRNRPASGRAIVLFQPAEETGAGAAAVISDPKFDQIQPDIALALHNFPGLPLGHVAITTGVMNCASRGMKLILEGRTAHASQPETGVSPAPAIARLITRLTALGKGGTPSDAEFSLVTITHVRIGEPAFGIAPGRAELWLTLRTQRDDRMAALVQAAESEITDATRPDNLSVTIGYHDIFAHCENHPEAVDIFRRAIADEAFPEANMPLPMRASEDFGRFGSCSKSAMVLLGAGESTPALHNPDYDFPDALIPDGVRLFGRCLRNVLG